MSKKLIASIVGTVAVAGGVGVAVLTANSQAAETAAVNVGKTSETSASTEVTKALVDETVYVFENADGSVKKTISSDWTKNSLGLDEYSKTANKTESPIETKISYKLNGEEIEARELAGKSGQVEITYEYTNNKQIGGRYVPYAVMKGLVLDNEHFKDIKVENGKLINDGSRTAIVGVTLPGLQEDLEVDRDVIDIPTSLTITAEATDFKLGMTMAFATSEIFSEIDTSSLDSLDGLKASLAQLQDGMTQLITGSTALYDGLAELNSKTGALVSGVEELTTGSAKLATGAADLSTGATSLSAGATSLSAGASELASGIASAKAGAANLSAVLTQISESGSSLTTGMSTVKAGVFTLVNQVLAGYGLTVTVTEDNYSAVFTALINQYPAMETSLRNMYSLLDGVVNLNSGLTSYTAGVSSTATGAASLSTGISSAASGASALASGASTLASGAEDLADGAETLATGAATLSAGMEELSGNLPALTDGVSRLASGAGELKDGLNTFNKNGIEKLVAAFDDISDLAERLKDTVNLSKNYGTKT